MFYVNDNKYGDDVAIAHEYMYDGSRDYYIGNSEGSKIGDLVYYRDEEGFWVRNLLDNVDKPVDFLNKMNIASKTAVGFLDNYIFVENKSYNYPNAEIYDLYDYEGNEMESQHDKQLAEQVYGVMFRFVSKDDFLKNVCAEEKRHSIDFVKKVIQEIKENGNNDDKELVGWFEKYYCEILEGLTVENVTIALENIMGLDWILSMDKSVAKYEKHKFDEDDSWMDLPEANSESFMDYKKRLLVELRKRKGDGKFSKIVMDYKKLCEALNLPYDSKH